MRFKIVALVSLLAVPSSIALSQLTFTSTSNLPQRTNNHLTKQASGQIIISSLEGLSIFNGTSSNTYYPGNTTMQGSNIQGIITGPATDFYFCTYNAIHQYLPDVDDFAYYQINNSSDSLVTEDYWCISSGDNLLHIKAGDDYCIFNTREKKKVACWPVGLRNKHILASSAIGPDYYLTTADGATLIRYVCGNNRQAVDSCALELSFDVTYLKPLQQRNIVVGGSRGNLAIFDIVDCQVIFTDKIHSQSINGICTFGSDALLVSTNDHILMYDIATREVVQTITPVDKQCGEPVTNLITPYVDQDSMLWIGADGQGVYYTDLKRPKFSNLLAGHVVRGIHQSAFGDFYFRLTQGGLIRYSKVSGASPVGNANGFTALAGTMSSANSLLYFNYVSKQLELLDMSTDNTLELIPEEPYEDLFFVQLHTLPDGTLLGNWLGYGLVEIDMHDNAYTLRSYCDLARDKSDQPITFIDSDNTGRLYIGTNQTTILVYEAHRDTHTFLTELNIPGDVYCISGPGQDSLTYLATKNGLYAIHHHTLDYRAVVDEDNIISGQIYAVLRDTTGYLWMSSNKGILRYHIATNKAWQFTEEDGVQALEFNTHAHHQTDDGHILFGGVNGVNYFNPYAVRLSTTRAPIDIYDFKVNDVVNDAYPKPMVLDTLLLPWRDNTISFQFLAIDYADPQSTRTQYRMSGVDDDWVQSPSAEGFARYANLAPGHYTFSILGANSDGVWNDEPRVVEITVVPPFWMTWWFRVGMAILLIGSGYWIIRSHYRRKMEKKDLLLRQQALIIEKQEAVEKERTRIASEMHDDLGSGLTTIRYLSERALKQARDQAEADEIRRIAEHSNSLVSNMSEIIWAMNSRFDTTQDLGGYIRRYASGYLEEHNVPFSFSSTRLSDSEITAEKRRNIFLVTKEILHNIVKHSDCQSVELHASGGAVFTAEFLERGSSGFDPEKAVESGNGLFNMQRRMEAIGGGIRFEPTPEGMRTRITVTLKS